MIEFLKSVFSSSNRCISYFTVCIEMLIPNFTLPPKFHYVNAYYEAIQVDFITSKGKNKPVIIFFGK